MLSTDKFYAKVTNPSGLVFGGDVQMVSTKNEVGNFDILAKHTNFISAIQERLEITISKNQKKIVNFNTGVIRVENGLVDIYVDL